MNNIADNRRNRPLGAAKRLAALLAAALLAVFGAEATPDITWLETVHNYGAIDEDAGPVTCRLRFVNRGKADVAILAARASCGCTTPEFSTAPVAPGDTGTVEVTYNPAGRPGRFTKSVKIETSDGVGDRLKSNLEITGVVVGASNTLRSRYPVELGKMNLRSSTVAFGEVSTRGVKSAYIEAYNVTGDTLHPYIDNVPPYILLKQVEPYAAPAEQMVWVLSFNGLRAPDYGIVTDSVTLHISPEDPGTPIDLVAIVREDFSRLTPAQRASAPVMSVAEPNADFGTMPRGASGRRAEFTITNRGKDPLLIRRVYTTDRGVEIISAPEKIKKGKSGKVVLQADPSVVPGEILNARVQIISNDPDNPVATVRAVGEIKD